MRAQGFVFLSGAPGVMPALHCHQEIEVNLITQGEITYQFGGRNIRISAGQLAIFSATIPHRVMRLSPETEYYCIHLPLPSFLRWQLPSRFTGRMLHGEVAFQRDDRWFERDLALFKQWRSDLDDPCPDTYRIIRLELEVRLCRMAGLIGASDVPMRREAGAVSADRGDGKIEQITAYIGGHYREPITTADIAAAAHVHPSYAMTLFRQRCGMTITEYITHLRLSEAQRLLATTDNTIVDIAFEAGFGSVSQFYERFKRSCGYSPRDFKRTHR